MYNSIVSLFLSRCRDMNTSFFKFSLHFLSSRHNSCFIIHMGNFSHMPLYIYHIDLNLIQFFSFWSTFDLFFIHMSESSEKKHFMSWIMVSKSIYNSDDIFLYFSFIIIIYQDKYRCLKFFSVMFEYYCDEKVLYHCIFAYFVFALQWYHI